MNRPNNIFSGFRALTGFLPVLLLAALLFLPALARADWGTVDFSVTNNDKSAYVTENIPDSAFTPEGLLLEIDGKKNYSWTSKRSFNSEFNFDMQIEVLEHSTNYNSKARLEMHLINKEKRRAGVGAYDITYWNATNCVSYSWQAYYKEGKPVSMSKDKVTPMNSLLAGIPLNSEWLRMYKAETMHIFFMGREKGKQYGWATGRYPCFNDMNEDCDEYQVGFRTGAENGGRMKVLIKAIKVSGATVAPRDPKKREFLFDFGPPNQELEDDFAGVNEFSEYSKEKGYGWVFEDPKQIRRNFFLSFGPPQLNDKDIARYAFQPIFGNDASNWWFAGACRVSYWQQQNDLRDFGSSTIGWSWIEFFKRHVDVHTPLEKDSVNMSRTYYFLASNSYRKDAEERRGSTYVDDDLSTEFWIDVPNGTYNLMVGAGGAWNLEVQGKVRKRAFNGMEQVPSVVVQDGKIRLRLFCDVRGPAQAWQHWGIATSWAISYLLVLPSEDKDGLNAWEWKIVKRKAERIRQVTFVEGDPAVMKNENGFLSLNGKPFYYSILQYNCMPGVTDHFPYYCLANTMTVANSLKASRHFFRRDWEKFSLAEDYPWANIDQMNTLYTWKYLGALQRLADISFVPRQVAGEGAPTVDSRGRVDRYNIQPPLNSALGKEIQKEVFTMTSNQLRLHPANGSAYLYEELWHPNETGYDDQSIIQYRTWLEERYKNIEALNGAWGRQYKVFDDVNPTLPGAKGFWEYEPEAVSFRLFRGWAQVQTVKSASELVHKLEPEHFIWGTKGDGATQSWNTGDYLDMFGWYGPYVAASVARYFGKTAISGGFLLSCEYSYVDGRKQLDHKPGPQNHIGHSDINLYPRMISNVFKGAKAFYVEWYNNGCQHAFHLTDLIRKASPTGGIKRWTGEMVFFEPEGMEGPPVYVERAALRASRANQMFYRLAPLWLPARPLAPKVLLATTEVSLFLNFFEGSSGLFMDDIARRVLGATCIPPDISRLDAIKKLSDYPVIILANTTAAISPNDVKRLREYVNQGGKLIILDAGGFTNSERPSRYNPDKACVFPLQEIADMAGYRFMGENWYHTPFCKATLAWTPCEAAPWTPREGTLGEYSLQYYYVPTNGSQTFLKGTLPDGKAVSYGLINKDRNIVVMHLPAGDDKVNRSVANWFAGLLKMWKVDGRVTLEGVPDSWEMYAGVLEGEDYTLAAVCNNNTQEVRKVSLKLNTLTNGGEYAVCDVTGERPDLVKKEDGGWALKPDDAARRSRIMARLDAREIAEKGIAAEIAPNQAQVFLIRPLRDKVWVSIWKPSLKAFIRRPVTVVHGAADASGKKQAERIMATLQKLGVKADILTDDKVKLKKEAHEVRIKPDGGARGPNEDMSKYYLVDTFENEFVVTARQLICVGSEESNSLIKHLDKRCSFAYDKSAEKITKDYPGSGRGVIAMVESVNSATYDPQTPSRDALVVGGSDASGTRAAVDRLIELLEMPDKK